MLFVIHATDKKDGMPTRAKFYRAHRTHLDHAMVEGVHVLTAGPLVADDGETPIGSLFIVEATRAVIRAGRHRFVAADSKTHKRVRDRITARPTYRLPNLPVDSLS